MHYWEVQVFYHFFTGIGGHSSEVVQILGKGGYSRDVRPCVPTPRNYHSAPRRFCRESLARTLCFCVSVVYLSGLLTYPWKSLVPSQ